METFQILLANVNHLEQENNVCLRPVSEVGRPQRVEVGRWTRQVAIQIPGFTRSLLVRNSALVSRLPKQASKSP